ncbi:MAG: MBL fold metallo-hydrolase [Candidatus Harrisonbacteria bacterium]|nr:MBL fold metallo-hydrolase [Candidatus Harrisonbacteria bacterium]
MIINWYGEGCFKAQTGGLTLLTDPFESSIGLTPPRGKSEVILKTLTSWPIKEEETSGQLIQGAGEYEVRGIEIRGFALLQESSEKFFKTAYKVIAEEMTLGFLGHLSEELSPEANQNLKDADLLFLPAGGKPFIDQEKAAKLIKQLSPKIVVASFFKTPGLKRTSSDWKGLAEEMDQKPEVTDHLTVKRKELKEQKGIKLVVLKI